MIKERNIAVAYILWLTFGILGAHKLYLRRPMMALLYLFTAGFFLIGWIVDLFTLGEQVDTCNDRIYNPLQREEQQSEDVEDYIDELEEQVEELQEELQEQRRKK